MKNKSWLKNKIEKHAKNDSYMLEGQILDITEQISIRLMELNWSKKDLAEKMNSSQAYITKLLNGKNNYTLKTLVKLAEILDVNLEINMVRKKGNIHDWIESKSTEEKNSLYKH
ncbi:MAG: helix-turn-helix domain-containing protein [Calditrichaceae bacterium]